MRDGYPISRQKIVLLISTGITSIWAWGFLPPLEAFFVANLFHGLQYFAIVWCSEQKNIRRLFGLVQNPAGRSLALFGFLASVAVLGVLYEVGMSMGLRWAASLALVVSLMHFWYDGFVWSVRKQQI